MGSQLGITSNFRKFLISQTPGLVSKEDGTKDNEKSFENIY
jgi:hypothetical protein